jgi:hypothetical protein
MRILGILIGIAITATTITMLGENDKLGDNISKTITVLRSHNWSAPNIAFAQSSLSILQDNIKRNKYQRELLEVEQERVQTDHEIAKRGLNLVINVIPNEGKCNTGRKQLIHRQSAALEKGVFNTTSAKQWSNYVRQQYCLKMPHIETFFIAPTHGKS